MRIHYRLIHPIHLDAAFEAKGLTVLLGRSGQGKTSLLRAIAGLLQASGEPYAGLPPQRRPIGYVPQSFSLFPHLSVWRNIAFSLSEHRRDEAMRLLESLGIGQLAEKWPSELSGGQQQRVALARALARKPELLLLDEPTSALDPITRDDVLDTLRHVVSETQVTILAVTHDREAARAADRLVILSEGQIVQEGPPSFLASSPATLEIARLMGVAFAAEN